jgi:hypothetical protein
MRKFFLYLLPGVPFFLSWKLSFQPNLPKAMLPLSSSFGLIQMDIGGHPPIPTGSHAVFIIGSYFLDFRVLNFWVVLRP